MEGYINHYRYCMGWLFTAIFALWSCFLVFSAFITLSKGMHGDIALTEAFLKAINEIVIALAMFELGLVVQKEYTDKEKNEDILIVLRRTLPRFVSMVCIALVLEGLLMIIKYSKLELAGNLYYPVAIVISAAILLASLGVFLKLTTAQSLSEAKSVQTATQPSCAALLP